MLNHGGQNSDDILNLIDIISICINICRIFDKFYKFQKTESLSTSFIFRSDLIFFKVKSLYAIICHVGIKNIPLSY